MEYMSVRGVCLDRQDTAEDGCLWNTERGKLVITLS
jgi:hypothetical protein